MQNELISTFLLAASDSTGSKSYPGMLNDLTGITLLTMMEIIGPLCLAVVIAWAIIYTRGRTRAQRARTDEATRRLYDQEEQARRHCSYRVVPSHLADCDWCASAPAPHASRAAARAAASSADR
jgi:hypothetical protein